MWSQNCSEDPLQRYFSLELSTESVRVLVCLVQRKVVRHWVEQYSHTMIVGFSNRSFDSSNGITIFINRRSCALILSYTLGAVESVKVQRCCPLRHNIILYWKMSPATHHDLLGTWRAVYIVRWHSCGHLLPHHGSIFFWYPDPGSGCIA